MTIEIPLTQGKTAIIDDEDASLAERRWYAVRVGRKADGSPRWYAGCWDKGRTLYLHVAVIGVLGADHVNRDGLDNRRANLRIATASQNLMNSGFRPHSSKFRGVSWDARSHLWESNIQRDGRKRRIGYFQDEVAAARAYDDAATTLFGVFATLNFAEEG